MTPSDIRRLRLRNQQISLSDCKYPADVVRWLVAMQAQEFRHAKWGIGLRLPGATEETVDKAFNDGAILRTHVMRPTWHFVAPEDIRWLLKLTAPRVHAANNPYYKTFGLSASLLKRSHNIIARSLEGGHCRTRTDLQELLKQKKISAEGPKLAYIMMHAELEGLICSGPRIGKQFSYALLEDRVPKTKDYEVDEVLPMFLMRYFTSRGPATLQDFTYWSGLTLKDARAGIDTVKNQLQKIVVDGKEYYSGNSIPSTMTTGQDTFLMPDYDEYGMSYKDRSALVPYTGDASASRKWSVFGHYVVVNGTMQGTWKDEVGKSSMKVSSKFIKPLTVNAKRKFKKALKRYTAFFGKNLHSRIDR